MPLDRILYQRTKIQPSGKQKSRQSGKRAAREMLLLCATSDISPERKKRISQISTGTIDWEYMLELTEFHSITPLIARNLVDNSAAAGIPQPYLDRFNQIYNNALYRNVILANELVNILSILNQHGIATIVLKGTTMTEQLYGNPGLRTVADIDILLKYEEISRAESLLRDMGYQQSVPEQEWEHPFHQVPYCRKAQFTLCVELHWNLDDQKLVTIPQHEVWRRAQNIQIQADTTMVLSSEDTLLLLSNNFSKPSGYRLRSLCDIAELLKKYDDVLDWDYIVESAHSWGIETAVHFALIRCKALLWVRVPASVIKSLEPKTWRRKLLNFLSSEKEFVSTTKPAKLISETCVVIRSLVVKNIHRMGFVLVKYHHDGKRGAWIRAAFWILLVFSTAFGRNIIRIMSRWWVRGI